MKSVPRETQPIPRMARPDTIRKALKAMQKHVSEVEEGKHNKMLYGLRSGGQYGDLGEVRKEYLKQCHRRMQQMLENI